MSVYKITMQDILKACESYKKGKIKLEHLQGVIWSGSDDIVSVEEKELREFLDEIGGELESIRFGCYEGNKEEKILSLVNEVEEIAKKEYEKEHPLY